MYGIHKIHYKCHQMGQWLFNIAATRLRFNLFPVWIHSSGNSRRGIYLVYIYSACLTFCQCLWLIPWPCYFGMIYTIFTLNSANISLPLEVGLHYLHLKGLSWRNKQLFQHWRELSTGEAASNEPMCLRSLRRGYLEWKQSSPKEGEAFHGSKQQGWCRGVRQSHSLSSHFLSQLISTLIWDSAPILCRTPLLFAQKRKILWENLKAQGLLFLGSTDTTASHFYGLLWCLPFSYYNNLYSYCDTHLSRRVSLALRLDEKVSKERKNSCRSQEIPITSFVEQQKSQRNEIKSAFKLLNIDSLLPWLPQANPKFSSSLASEARAQ